MLRPKMGSLLVIACLLASVCTLVAVAHPASMPSSSSPSSSSDPLPPDTFRKLAQALYQRSGGAESGLGAGAGGPLMRRKLLYDHEVTCNDGSVAGYYIRRNYKSKKWIVFLEGKIGTSSAVFSLLHLH